MENASIGELSVPGNGMSSETVLLDATWTEDIGEERAAELVVRMEAPVDAVPAFPSYDLALQAKVMDLVGRTTDAPVPEVRWFEERHELRGLRVLRDGP